MPSHKIITCIICRRERGHSGRGMCSTCHRRSIMCSCTRCGLYGTLGSKKAGLCRSCFDADYYASAQVKAKWPWARRSLRSAGKGIDRSAISLNFLTELQQKTPNCPCCKVLMSYSLDKGQKRPTHQATIDRVDPLAGYTEDNIAIICMDCNRRKTNSTQKDLEMILTYVKKFSMKARVA